MSSKPDQKGDQLSAAPAQFNLTSIMHHIKNPNREPTERFDGKTVLVTGANTGLGLEAAIWFAKLGASKLIFGVRTPSKGEAAKAKIEEAIASAGLKNTTAISIHKLDALDYASIRSFANEVCETYSNINIAVLNAGIGGVVHELSPQGYERMIQVNGIATTYLALLLVPKLKSTSVAVGYPSVLEFVASEAHSLVSADQVSCQKNLLHALSDKKNFSAVGTYGISKLLCMWSMRQVAARIDKSQVVVLAVCPGLCKSDIARDASVVVRALDSLWKKLAARSAEEGGRAYVTGVVQGEKIHGGYWKRDRVSVPGVLVTSAEGVAANNVYWSEMLDIFEVESPGLGKQWS